ncbi:transient receptor potential cation channel subfamily M member 1-like [Lytechinus pictus]|uniref:transient receptor potential cation channel subfamily M member 1-like n=1 Tax=Lytechinus pictus TaxID=7653 RepID=UPI0030B9F2D3
MKAIQTISVWVISGGTNVGVRKVVGTAVREARSMARISKETIPKFALIGLPPWAYVAGTDRLINEKNEEIRHVSYKVDPEEKRGQPSPLNPDHTHFILIDCGRKNKYGESAELKAKIQELMLQPESEGGLGIPVVNVILEGGIDTFETVAHAVRRHTPVILCNGTGRVADILSYATRHAEEIGDTRQVKPSCLPMLREKIHVLLNIGYDTQEMADVLDKIDHCIVDEDLLTIFEMQKKEHIDLDLAILSALLKLHAVTPLNQLSLAMSWDRADVAESKIFTDDVSIPLPKLHPFITDALVNNRVEFLRLFIERGAIIKDYLTVVRLRRLYNSAPDTCFLRTLIDDVLHRKPGQPIFLHDIGVLIKYLTGTHHEPLYSNDRHYRRNTNRETRALLVLSTSLTGMNLLNSAQEEYIHTNHYKNALTTGAAHLSLVELANPGMHFDHPFRELFIWAVLSDRPEIAAYLWEQVDDPLSSAITASAILTRMSDIQISLPYSDDDYIINARKFEQLAIGIIEKCHEANEEMSQKLVSFTQTRWNKSVIHMAAESHNKEFVSHPCCQGYVHAIWLNGLAARNILILFTLFFPILIPYLIGFKEMEEAVSKESSKLSLYQKFRMYYKAPITKFYYFLVAYVMFLMLYSLFIMFYFRAEPSLVEYIVFTWVISFVIEEFTEILLSNSELTIKQCFKVWFKSGWNKFDVCVLVPSTLAFGLHWYPPAVEVSRSIYAVTCMLYYVRVLRLFSASTHLGPKMVMIWKMMQEMVAFLSILAMFLLGYGFASQSLLFPNQDISWFSFKNALLVPYFQIYGELHLDAIQHGEMDGCGMEGGHPCPTENMLVVFLLAIYLLIGNVLLLNLLVAIFSRIFEDIQANSLVIWRFEYYFLVMEFKDKSWLPPPLNVIYHFYTLLRWVCRFCIRTCTEKSDNEVHEKRKLEEINLHLFERECAAEFRRDRAEDQDEDLEQRMERMEKKIDELGEAISHLIPKEHSIKSEVHRKESTAKPPSSMPAPKRDSSVTSPVRKELDFNTPSSSLTASNFKEASASHAGQSAGAGDVHEGRKRFVEQMNNMNDFLQRSQSGSRTPCIPPLPQSSRSPLILSGDSQLSQSEMQSFMNLMQQNPAWNAIGRQPVNHDANDGSDNYVLEHTIIESPTISEMSVRSPPEGGDVPRSNSRPKSASKKRRKKKRVAPESKESSADAWSVSSNEYSPRGSRTPSSTVSHTHSYPAWYQKSAFPTIREQADEEQEQQQLKD